MKTDEAKSHNSRELEKRMGTRDLVVLGTKATERNSMMVDESDTTMAKGKLNEATFLAEHVEKMNGSRWTTRKTAAPWLITSKSAARAGLPTPGWSSRASQLR